MISEGDDRPPNAVKDALSAYGYRCVLYASAAAGDYRTFIGLSPAYVRGRARMREMKYARTEYATKSLRFRVLGRLLFGSVQVFEGCVIYRMKTPSIGHLDFILAARQHGDTMLMYCAAIVDDRDLYGAISRGYNSVCGPRELCRRIKNYRMQVWIRQAYPGHVAECLLCPIFDRHRIPESRCRR